MTLTFPVGATRANSLAIVVAIAALAVIAQSDARADTVFAVVSTEAFNEVATLNDGLGVISQIPLPGPITGLAAGTGGNFYTAVGNSIFEYDAAGDQIASMTAGTPTATFPALSFAGDTVFAVVSTGAFNEVATLSDDLIVTSQIALPGPITGLAAGTGGDFYTAVGNSIFEYDAAGDQIASMTAGTPTATFPALSFSATVAPSVPEPSSIVMMATGLAALWPLSKRRIKDRTIRKLASPA